MSICHRNVAYKMRDPQWCLKQAEATGPHCHRFMQRLLENRILDRLRPHRALSAWPNATAPCDWRRPASGRCLDNISTVPCG
jgi:hypothetical protein